MNYNNQNDAFDATIESDNDLDETPDGEVLLPSRHTARHVSLYNLFDGRSVQIDLLRGSVGGPIARLLQHRRMMTDRKRSSEIVRSWTDFYKDAAELMRARREYDKAQLDLHTVEDDLITERKQRELRQAELDHDIAAARIATRKMLEPEPAPYGQEQMLKKDLDLKLQRIATEISELQARAARAQYEAEHVADFVQRPTAAAKPTIQEVRKRKVRRQQVELDDKLALRMSRLKLRDKIRRELSKLGGVDDEDREQLEQRLFDELTAEDPDGETL